MLMPCFSQSPDSTSLIENPDLTAILLDEPSGRFIQQYLGDFSLSGTNAGNLEVSDLIGEKKSQCPMGKVRTCLNFQSLYKSNQEAHYLPFLQFRNPSKYHKYYIILKPEKTVQIKTTALQKSKRISRRDEVSA